LREYTTRSWWKIQKREIGQKLRESFDITVKNVLLVTDHERICAHNPLLRRLLALRNPFLDPINILQIQILKELRSNDDTNTKKLKNALLLTINGIAAGMRNTG